MPNASDEGCGWCHRPEKQAWETGSQAWLAHATCRDALRQRDIKRALIERKPFVVQRHFRVPAETGLGWTEYEAGQVLDTHTGAELMRVHQLGPSTLQIKEDGSEQ